MNNKIKREFFSISLTLLITLPLLFIQTESEPFDMKNILLSAVLFFISRKLYDFLDTKKIKK